MELSISSCSPRTTTQTVTMSASRILHPALASSLLESGPSASRLINLPMLSRLLQPVVAHSASRPLSARVPTHSVPVVAPPSDKLLSLLKLLPLDNHRHWAEVVVSDSHLHSAVEVAALGSRQLSVRLPAPLANLHLWLRMHHQGSVRPPLWARNPARSDLQPLASRRSLPNQADSASHRSLAQSPTLSLRAPLPQLQAHLAAWPRMATLQPAHVLLEPLVRLTTPTAPSPRMHSKLLRVRLDSPLPPPVQAHSDSRSSRRHLRCPWTHLPLHSPPTHLQLLVTRRQLPRTPSDSRRSWALRIRLRKQHRPALASLPLLSLPPQPLPPAEQRVPTHPERVVNIHLTRVTRPRLLPVSSRHSRASQSPTRRSTGNRSPVFETSMVAGPKFGSPTVPPHTTRIRNQTGPTRTRRRLSTRSSSERASFSWLARVVVECQKRLLQGTSAPGTYERKWSDVMDTLPVSG